MIPLKTLLLITILDAVMIWLLIEIYCIRITTSHLDINRGLIISLLVVVLVSLFPVATLSDEVNFSDHLPIICVIKIPVNDCATLLGLTPRPPRRYVKECWDKADLVSYYSQSGALLQTIATSVSLLQCSAGCQCDRHKASIDSVL